MFKKLFIFTLSLSLISIQSIIPAQADLLSDAAELGANSGAMKYCKENFANEDTDSSYNVLSLQTLREYNDLSSGDKVKALVWKKAAEDGDYLGDPLTKERCEDIRGLLILRYGL